MRVRRGLLSSLTSKNLTRRFAQVHDVRIEVTSRRNTASPREPSAAAEERTGEEHKTMERNVFQQPLKLHSTSPLTGFLRTGYCETPKSDYGNHSVAAEVSEEFLDFSASRGNDLRSAGLTGGCKWCLCVSRWKEAFDARLGHKDGDKVVPKVWLERTNERALEGVGLEELRLFAVDGGGKSGGGGGSTGEKK